MHVRSQPGATGWFDNIDLERRGDGVLVFNGQEIGRLTGGQIFTLEAQAVPLVGRISIGTRAGREHMTAQPDGSILMDAGTLTIDAQGDVSLTRRGRPSAPVHVRIEGHRADVIVQSATMLIYAISKADLASR